MRLTERRTTTVACAAVFTVGRRSFSCWQWELRFRLGRVGSRRL